MIADLHLHGDVLTIDHSTRADRYNERLTRLLLIILTWKNDTACSGLLHLLLLKYDSVK